MATSNRWGGWIAFAGWTMMIIGSLEALEGLIAIIRGQYYVLTSNQVIVFDVKTWGWVTLFWGILVTFAGIAVIVGSEWGRWFAIIVGSLTFIEQLGFVGSNQYPLWALTVLILTVVVLYALIVRWDDAKEDLELA